MEPQHKHIALSGFMGTGKTTLAKHIAKELSLQRFDLDEEIERRLGMRIPDIFQRRGEGYFREQEHRILCKLISEKHPKHVLSLGGGTLCNARSCESVRAHYHIFSLIVPLSIIARRVTQSDRPLKSKLHSLYQERKEHYEQVGEPIYLHEESPEEALVIFLRAWRGVA